MFVFQQDAWYNTFLLQSCQPVSSSFGKRLKKNNYIALVFSQAVGSIFISISFMTSEVPKR